MREAGIALLMVLLQNEQSVLAATLPHLSFAVEKVWPKSLEDYVRAAVYLSATLHSPQANPCWGCRRRELALGVLHDVPSILFTNGSSALRLQPLLSDRKHTITGTFALGNTPLRLCNASDCHFDIGNELLYCDSFIA
ncbi:unnamed protein product [Cylicocyclus nassatus]|uniref:Uncharacterized protein n=1 Tax=Cylicocyclus nassatus TaxID=53992 RepID=A0AA36HDK4_CYLNA|nr:unnamed protein product [Cylicocyclus nassatus]